jgi:DNA polymerase-3 subunit alpha
MTALLSVSKHETEKVALYANDARQMGVDVLPPDVNASGWDFAIEPREGKDAIRFGLGAIKNVGQNSVEAIVKARAKGDPFTDLNDFAARVDLRVVGKRALECLIKVGALDKFGKRTAMLDSLDQISAVSSSHFRAAEAGQLSLFGAATGVQESIRLPLVPDPDRRELLNWERELMGMYMSEHPLAVYMNEIRRVVTHFANTLGDAAHEEKTRVAGMVTGIRPHQTKTGKMMAWVTLEDLTGIIELVLFPRTWEKFQFVVEIGGVIVAEGKVDAQNSPSKVLVDNLRTQIKLTEPAQIPLQPAPGRDEGSQRNAAGRIPPGKPAPARPASPTPARPGGPTGRAARPAESKPASRPPVPVVEDSDIDFDDMPPPPDNPPEWDSYTPAETAKFGVPDLVAHEPDLPEEISDQYSVNSDPPALSGAEGLSVKSEPSSAKSVVAVAVPPPTVYRSPSDEPVAPRLDPQPPAALPADEHAPQMVTIILRPTGDADRDIRRISRLHGTFISFPGKDRFAFQVFEDGKGHLIEFPNDTTRVCAEMMKKVRDFVDEENIRVEPITYQ